MTTDSRNVEHTPGPWELCIHLRGETACRCGYAGGIWSGDGQYLILEMGAHGQGGDMVPVPPEAEQRANAKLIAAAPKMLQALWHLRGRLEVWCERHDFMSDEDAAALKLATEAIDTAEGRA